MITDKELFGMPIRPLVVDWETNGCIIGHTIGRFTLEIMFFSSENIWSRRESDGLNVDRAIWKLRLARARQWMYFSGQR
jgi:hypothetical protein